MDRYAGPKAPLITRDPNITVVKKHEPRTVPKR
jgi:hypothetical protein